MRHANAARYARGIGDALQRFDEAESSQDGDAIWNRTVEVLAALYRAQEAEREHDSTYWDDLRSSAHGRVLHGLMFFRGLVEHKGIEVRELAWHDTEAKIRQDGKWRDAHVRIFTDGQWREAALRIARTGWPSLPSYEDARSTFDRGLLYRDHVEGRRLSETLQEAASFLLER